jgi:hypothetical protein
MVVTGIPMMLVYVTDVAESMKWTEMPCKSCRIGKVRPEMRLPNDRFSGS